MKYAIVLLCLMANSCQTRQSKNTDPSLRTADSLPANSSHLAYTDHACNQNRLSDQFDIAIRMRHYTDGPLDIDSSIMHAVITDKKTGVPLDSFSLTVNHAYMDLYTSCDSMTSFTTGYKSTRELADNYMGDIVVADFNFDKKDDIAAINDCASNSGPFYSFYTQTADKKFVLDRFLTDSVVFFPSTIEPNKGLITLVHAGACCAGQHLYQLDAKTGQWKQTSHKILGRTSKK